MNVEYKLLDAVEAEAAGVAAGSFPAFCYSRSRVLDVGDGCKWWKRGQNLRSFRNSKILSIMEVRSLRRGRVVSRDPSMVLSSSMSFEIQNQKTFKKPPKNQNREKNVCMCLNDSRRG